MRILTYDIGGAYTKRMLSDFETLEVCSSEVFYFPFWKRKHEFKSFLKSIREKADYVGVTMTAELSDAFESRASGVEYIVSTCEKVFESPAYLSIDQKLLKKEEIKEPLKLAAANWMASVYYLEKKFGEGILVDVGSTTTDIIPFKKNEVLYKKTDLERLQSNHLIYTGVLRTPVNAVLSEVPFKGKLVGISAEHFAITADVYNIVDTIEYSCETPDGRGKGRAESMARIARLLCADANEIGKEEIEKICRYVRGFQVEKIARALNEVAESTGIYSAYIAGVGRKVANEACKKAGLKPLEVHRNLPCMGLADMMHDYVRSKL